MKPSEKALLKVFRELSKTDQENVQNFTDFLRAKNPKPATEDLPVVIIPRPETESVVAAMKRLSASYPMLDKPDLLNKTSALMTQHVMQGKESILVIDEMEALFLGQYEEFLATNK